ncbi:hypothetical protein OT793_18070 [Edwardsiella ictaluri]|uniref:hypothetical protein n=1 Tax=Edwardsiella ictaluri TaxID=67780 RepID=UPI003784F3F8
MSTLQHDPAPIPLTPRLTHGILSQLIRLPLGIEDVAELRAYLALVPDRSPPKPQAE